MTYKEIRLDEIPCLEFMQESHCNLYVGPKLSWWQRRRLKKVESELNVIYLYDVIDGITKDQLSYNFPGVTFPKDFSAQTIFCSIREQIHEYTGVRIPQESKFFIRFDGMEFVVLEGTSNFNHALSYLKEKGFESLWIEKDRMVCCNESREYDPREIYDLEDDYNYDFSCEETVDKELDFVCDDDESDSIFNEEECEIRFRVSSADDNDIRYRAQDIQPVKHVERHKRKLADKSSETIKGQSPEDVKKAIETLLMTGFPVDVIKSWLDENVRLSRLRITRQFRILLVDYDKEVRMGPLPKTVFLFYLRHPEGVQFSYLQDHVKELHHIYGRLSRNDDPKKMEESIASLINPFNNSISEKCTAVKNAFLKQVNEDVSKHYYIRGVQGGKKGIALNRELVEWECEL